MAKVFFDGIKFDSQEEVDFYCWCKDALKLGILTDFACKPDSIEIIPAKHKIVEKQLKTKVKYEKKSLLQSLNYTPDFFLFPAKEYEEFLDTILYPTHEVSDKKCYVIDVKGSFGRYGDGVKFPVLQKILYHEKNIFSNKLVPKKFFEKAGRPTLFTPKGAISNKLSDIKTTLEGAFFNGKL